MKKFFKEITWIIIAILIVTLNDFFLQNFNSLSLISIPVALIIFLTTQHLYHRALFLTLLAGYLTDLNSGNFFGINLFIFFITFILTLFINQKFLKGDTYFSFLIQGFGGAIIQQLLFLGFLFAIHYSEGSQLVNRNILQLSLIQILFSVFLVMAGAFFLKYSFVFRRTLNAD